MEFGSRDGSLLAPDKAGIDAEKLHLDELPFSEGSSQFLKKLPFGLLLGHSISAYRGVGEKRTDLRICDPLDLRLSGIRGVPVFGEAPKRFPKTLAIKSNISIIS
jgi:hypothetical protein